MRNLRKRLNHTCHFKYSGFVSTTAREDETRATSESSSSIAFNQSSTTFDLNARRLSTSESTVEAGKKTFFSNIVTRLS